MVARGRYLLGAVPGGGCTKQSANAQVDIDTEVNVCLKGGQLCYALPVPDGSVEIADSGGRVLATGTTDECGRVTLSVPMSLTHGKSLFAPHCSRMVW
jgi:hypothetical protein